MEKHLRAHPERGKASALRVHDGPPYPTVKSTLGTGLNKILKDLVVKTRACGALCPYVPGWIAMGCRLKPSGKKLGERESAPAEFEN